jgi:hypothetical protein
MIIRMITIITIITTIITIIIMFDASAYVCPDVYG